MRQALPSLSHDDLPTICTPVTSQRRLFFFLLLAVLPVGLSTLVVFSRHGRFILATPRQKRGFIRPPAKEPAAPKTYPGHVEPHHHTASFALDRPGSRYLCEDLGPDPRTVREPCGRTAGLCLTVPAVRPETHRDRPPGQPRDRLTGAASLAQRNMPRRVVN